MALLSSRGISTPSLPAQGEQRRSSIFNIPRDIPAVAVGPDQVVEAEATREKNIAPMERPEAKATNVVLAGSRIIVI
jgi:hypothetical protein